MKALFKEIILHCFFYLIIDESLAKDKYIQGDVIGTR